MLYWQIRRNIRQRQETDGWGARVIDRLSADLRHAFPEMKAFSARNFKYRRAFAVAWPDEAFVQQPAAQIPWFHNYILPDKLKDPDWRAWYANVAFSVTRCFAHGRAVRSGADQLVRQRGSRLPSVT